MKLIEIKEVPAACNTSDMRKSVCRFAVVCRTTTFPNGIQDMHDAFAEVKIPEPRPLTAIKSNNKWFWAMDDGIREPSDNLP